MSTHWSLSRKLERTIAPFRQRIDERWSPWGFFGWGRKKYGRLAQSASRILNRPFLCLEDGFVRSVGLGNSNDPVLSIVVDDVGIYYDATGPSRLEQLLSGYDFESDTNLMEMARSAIKQMRYHRISKYNHAPDISEGFFSRTDQKRVLIIAQTEGDMSLQYGLAERFSTAEMITSAFDENPGAEVIVKLHPDVLAGTKRSDIVLSAIPSTCRIIDFDVNPLSLLEYVDRVYTKTSLMGFEALIMQKECVCFGMPFYAGWGVTDDRISCSRRQRILSVEQIFAAAYLLYPLYYDPVEKCTSTLIEVLARIIDRKQKLL